MGDFNSLRGQQHLFDDADYYDVSSRSTLAKEDHSDKTKRRSAQPFQQKLPFESDTSTIPNNWALHSVRQANPKLNDYQFRHHQGDYEYGNDNEVHVWHKDESGQERKAGYLKWAAHPPEDHYDPFGGNEHDGEVQMVHVERAHQGKGIATAMWDYAISHEDFYDQEPKHSSNRSQAGNAWARYVGGPENERTHGFEYRHY